MTTSSFFVSHAALRNLKERARRHVPGVSSSHLSEAIAFALGFRTHAALRAAFAGRPTAEARKPDNVALVRRLHELGYHEIPQDTRPLPALDVSYSPFRTYPLRKSYGVRWRAWRNLMVATVNAGLEQRLFGLSPGEDWWPRARAEEGTARGLFRFSLDGDMQALASVDAISGDELSLHVALNPASGIVDPDETIGIDRAAAFGRCWLERRLGAWIQDGGEDFGCKRTIMQRVVGIQIKPLGYADQGSFIM